MITLLWGACALAQGTDPARDPDALPDLRVATGQGEIARAWLIGPTDRYAHFAFDTPYQASGLRLVTRGGEVLTYLVPAPAVFEDREVRLADMTGDGQDDLLVVESDAENGARLALFTLEDGRIKRIGATRAMGQANRWLNPGPIADFNGDGRLDVALVAMPHLVKRLEFWTWLNSQFIQLSATNDVSTHQYGSGRMRLWATADVNEDGVMDLIVPDGSRQTLRVLSIANGRLRQIWHISLAAPVVGDFHLRRTDEGYAIETMLETGPVSISLGKPRSGAGS